MARVGWSRDVLKSGDQVTVSYLPLKDGRPGGVLLRATRPNGQVLSGDPLTLQAAKDLLKVAK
jgi:hypothetical protein